MPFDKRSGARDNREPGKDLTEIYTWTEVDPDGGEGTILALVPAMPRLGPVNLVTRSRAIAEGPLREVALKHQRASGHRVRLVRWTHREDLEELK
jgi:hypothetical protein